MMLAECSHVKVSKGEKAEELIVRCRTVGDMTCTGLIESKASTIDEVIREVIASRTSERGLRADDKVSEAAMEDRKKQGYF
jgi:sulfate adenylyltransferase subunit 2